MAIGAAREGREETLGMLGHGTKGANGKEGETKVGGEGEGIEPILIAAGGSYNMGMHS